MNTWFTRALAGASMLAALNLASCNKDETKVTLTPSNVPTLTASATTVNLVQTAGAQPAITYTWTPVKSLDLSDASTTTAAIVYYLQFDQKGHDFGTPASIALDAPAAGATTATSTIKVSDLNTALTKAGLAVGKATDVEVRINASYAPNSATYSNTLPLNATIYECKQPTADKAWSIIGTVGPGTDWSSDYVMTFDCSTNSFMYTGKLKVGVYKFRYGGAWTTNLGGASSTGGPLTQGGANLTIDTAGTYTIELKPAVDATGTGSGTYTIK